LDSPFDFNDGYTKSLSIFVYIKLIFFSALRVDIYRHVFENILVHDNAGDGLGVVFSDLYYPENIANVKNANFSGNRGNGIVLLSLGLKLTG